MSDSPFQLIALSALVESDRNPRKYFDQVKLGELADSIKALGVHTPILVRPLPGRRVPETSSDVTHEIIAGARRYRASQLAGQLMIPAVIHEMNDNEALEAAIVENLQRDGLSELDEAEGYDALMQHSGMNADDVGRKIGKSRSYVYSRLKLMDLCPEGRDAMRAGDLDASKGLLAARVPTHKLQLRAIEEFTRKDHRGETMSARAASEWLRNNLMLRLDNAVFDIKDATLVAGAGACGKCPKRTGANPELFTDVGSADVCTDTACFNDKIQAHTDQVVAKAKKKGLEVIDGEEAAKIKPYAGTDHLRGYENVDDKIAAHIKGMSTSYREQATPAELKQIKVLVDPHTRQTIEVIPSELGRELYNRACAAHAKAQPKTKEETAKDRERALKVKRDALEERYHETWRADAVQLIEERLTAGEVTQLEPDMLRAVLFYLVAPDDQNDTGILWDLLGAAGLGNYPDANEVLRTLAKADDLQLGFNLLKWLLRMEKGANFDWEKNERVYTLSAPMIDACAKRLNIDVDAIRDGVKASMRAEFAALEQPEPTDPPAAQASGVRGGKTGSKASAAPAAKKSKTSAEEAQRGIAAAMQGAEEAAASTAALPPSVGPASAVLCTGATVKVSSKASNKRWRGKTGTVGKLISGQWMVSFLVTPLTGEPIRTPCMFNPGDLTVVAAEEVKPGAADAAQNIEGAADDGRADQGGKVVQDNGGAAIEVGHRVEVVGDQLTGQWGEVSGLQDRHVFVELDGLTSEYIFEPAELKSHGKMVTA